jgi:hypothetical protein
MIQALSRDYAITLLTASEPDWSYINDVFGAAITPTDVDVRVMPTQVHWMDRLRPRFSGLPAVRRCQLLNEARRIGDGFDLVVGTDNESALGPRAME